jgi:hypothetical protein
MQITVKLFGTLRRFANPETPGRWQGEVPLGLTVRGLIVLLGTQPAEVAAASINGEPAAFDVSIPPDALVVLVTPVGGG